MDPLLKASYPALSIIETAPPEAQEWSKAVQAAFPPQSLEEREALIDLICYGIFTFNFAAEFEAKIHPLLTLIADGASVDNVIQDREEHFRRCQRIAEIQTLDDVTCEALNGVIDALDRDHTHLLSLIAELSKTDSLSALAQKVEQKMQLFFQRLQAIEAKLNE